MQIGKTKRTLFFYFAIAAVALLVIMAVYYVVSYNNTIASYVDSGYDRATVVAYMPFLSSVLPSWSTVITSYGLLAAVLFAADAILVAIKKNAPEKEVEFEEIEAVIKPAKKAKAQTEKEEEIKA